MNLVTTKEELLELAATLFIRGVDTIETDELLKCRDFQDVQQLKDDYYSRVIEEAVNEFIINESKYGL